jgi:hypothetical protein
MVPLVQLCMGLASGRLPMLRAVGRGMFEQGQGHLNLTAAAMFLDEYEPMVTVLPALINTTACPLFWPYCAQGIAPGKSPI